MVADLKMKGVQRLLVRVPGSGQSQETVIPEATLCDLSRVSSLAATVPVNPYVVAIMTGAKQAGGAAPSVSLEKNKLARREVIPWMATTPSHSRQAREEAAKQGTKRPGPSVYNASQSTAGHKVARGSHTLSQPATVAATIQSRAVLVAAKRVNSVPAAVNSLSAVQ